MNSKTVFSSKAEKYARYRWDYAPAAVEALLAIARISEASCIADIGAGTGILTRHFAGRAGRIVAVEPNAEMREWAARALDGCPSCTVIDASAEETTLPSHSVDLVTVAEAIHWFDPEPARKEFLRILKPGGWLALLHNRGTDERLDRALTEISTPENGVGLVRVARPPERKPFSFYCGGDTFQKMAFPFSCQENWDEFLGALCSTSSMPDEDHPLFKSFTTAARQVFDRFSTNGWLTVRGETELWIGQPVQAD